MKELFKVKFLLILENDFDFVKRERNIILLFVVKENYLWDYVYVKYFCGVGKFYVRLNINKDVIGGICIFIFNDSDSILLVMLFLSSYKFICLVNIIIFIFVGEEVLLILLDVLFMDENIFFLIVLFFEVELSDIRDVFNYCGFFELVVEKLSEKVDICE